MIAAGGNASSRVARPSRDSVVVPGWFAVFARRPHSWLKSVVLPVFGLPSRATRIRSADDRATFVPRRCAPIAGRAADTIPAPRGARERPRRPGRSGSIGPRESTGSQPARPENDSPDRGRGRRACRGKPDRDRRTPIGHDHRPRGRPRRPRTADDRAIQGRRTSAFFGGPARAICLLRQSLKWGFRLPQSGDLRSSSRS